MKAMILAAGRGSRMDTLTELLPKPLLEVKGKALIEYQLERLNKAGITECLINLHYQGDLIQKKLGNGERYGLSITYSVEEEVLETAGGIIHALPFFGNQPFVIISADVLCDYPLEKLTLPENSLAHCVLVENPDHHPQGDFAIDENNILSREGEKRTYANQGIYHPTLFADYEAGYRKLSEVLFDGIAKAQITGEHYRGTWLNVDTPERLARAQDVEI